VVARLFRRSRRWRADGTFLLHLGGKIETQAKVPLRHRDDLSMAYTPGVARVALAIAASPR
jgi:malate dehydrogenase (oxaloacetate-decarboxylating)